MIKATTAATAKGKRDRKEEERKRDNTALMRVSCLPRRPPTRNTAAVALYSTVINACSAVEFTAWLCFVLFCFFCPPFRLFGTLVLASSNPLAPIIISALLITHNKETWRRCAVHNSRDFFPILKVKICF